MGTRGNNRKHVQGNLSVLSMSHGLIFLNISLKFDYNSLTGIILPVMKFLSIYRLVFVVCI